MKKTILFIPFFCMCAIAFGALKPQIITSAANHLQEVNRCWKQEKPVAGIRSFQSERERISYHLLQVEQLLRGKSTPALNSIQISKRLHLLDVLHDYAQQGIFPVNSYHAARQPYFIDKYGTHCAVGYLLKASGNGHIAQDISQRQNYAYVSEIRSNELLDWSREYGFSVDELALIQPTYQTTQSYEQVEGGTNGTVRILTSHYYRLSIAGDFDTLNNMPCLNIGYYENNQLSCYGQGIEGKIVGVDRAMGGTITAAGKLISNGTTYPVATFDGTDWNFESIPGRPNAEAVAVGIAFNRLEVAIPHPTDPAKQEIWGKYAQGGGWSLKAIVEGSVYAIMSTPWRVYAGKFDAITVTEGGIDQVYTTKNALINVSEGAWETVQSGVSDTVFCIASNDMAIYFGGSASNLPSRSNVCISRYLNGVMQPLVLAQSMTNPQYTCIRDIEINYGGSSLVAVGDFSPASMMYWGRNIASVSQTNGSMGPMSVLTKPVHAVARVNTTWYFGGEFTTDDNHNILNRLIKLKSAVGLEEMEQEQASFTLAPNPSDGTFGISSATQIESVSIQDIQGKQWKQVTTGFEQIDASELPAGVYLVEVHTANGGQQVLRWIRN